MKKFTQKIVFSFGLISSCVCGDAYAQNVAAGVGPAQPVVGSAWSTIDAVVREPCLRNISTREDRSGSNSTKTITLIRSSETIREKIAMSASASFGFGVYGGNLAAEYLQEQKTSRYATFLYILIEEQVGKRVLVNSQQLVGGISNPATSGAAFYRRCGNSTITAGLIGGRYEAMLRIEAETSEQQKALEVALGAFGPSFNVNTASQIASELKKYRSTVTAKQAMSGVILPFPAEDPDEILKFATNFPNQIKNNPTENTIYSFEWMDYPSMVNNFPTTQDLNSAVLERLADLYEDARRTRGSIDYIRRHTAEFSGAFLLPSNTAEKIQHYVDQIREIARNCSRTDNGCSQVTVPDPISTSIRLPEPLIWTPPSDATNDVKNDFVRSMSFQPVGTIAQGEVRVLEVAGFFNCSGPGTQCLSDGITYKVIDTSGNEVDKGSLSSTGRSTVEIRKAGRVMVRVADGPGPAEFQDNYIKQGDPLRVTLW